LLSTAKYESIQDSQDKVSSDVFNNACANRPFALTNRLQNVRLAIGESESTTVRWTPQRQRSAGSHQ